MKPLLAAKVTTEDFTKLRFPLLASPKLDGIRCLIDKGTALTRKLKLVPNGRVQQWAHKNRKLLQGLDGELIVGSPTADVCYTTTMSAIMSRDGEPDFTFYVFDRWDLYDQPFNLRLKLLRTDLPELKAVVQRKVMNIDEMLNYEEACLAEGYEGIMLRSIDGAYKYGRSTLKEQHLLKLKRMEDAEAEIVGFKELMHNHNPKTTNELGNAKRSSHKAGKVAGGVLGSFIVRDRKTRIEFDIGTGLTAEMRKEFWNKRNQLKGSLVKYRYLPVGVKEAPRHPVFLGFRSEDDL